MPGQQWLVDLIEMPVKNAKILLMSQKRKEGLLAILPMDLVIAIAKLVWIEHFVITNRSFRHHLRETVWRRDLWNTFRVEEHGRAFWLTGAEKHVWCQSLQKLDLMTKEYYQVLSEEKSSPKRTNELYRFLCLQLNGFFWDKETNSFLLELDDLDESDEFNDKDNGKTAKFDRDADDRWIILLKAISSVDLLFIGHLHKFLGFSLR